MPDFANWLMVFLRASSMLAVFPIFSARNFPVQLRLALGALLAGMVSAGFPANAVQPSDFIGLAGMMAAEVGLGLLIGFACRMVFFTLEIAGSIIGTEVGLTAPPGINPISDSPMTSMATIMYYFAAMLFLSLDMHHWMLVGFQKTYVFLPLGGTAHFSKAVVNDMTTLTGGIFTVALQMSAPLLAVSFIVSLVFAVLGRAVPQMNVFSESFAVRPLVGLTVFGLTLDLMSQHIMNYLRHLPEDMLRVAKAMS